MDTKEPIHQISREIIVDKEYLNIPVLWVKDKKSEGNSLDMFEGDSLVRQTKCWLPDPGERPDWVYSMDMSAFKGKRLLLKTTTADVKALQNITLSDEPEEKKPVDLYDEERRPQFHFSARRGWINDPNGLHYADGKWHLFFQFNPFYKGLHGAGVNMHWGYATSTDLFHWTEHEPAAYPDKWGQCYSGSGFLDIPNTLGKNAGGKPAQVLCYSAMGRSSMNTPNDVQNLLYSVDGGRRWINWENNPSLPHQFDGNRDPKILYHEKTQKWIMVLFNGKDGYWIFTSKDLKDWRKTDELPGFHECPELFELPVDGNPENKKWIIYGGWYHGKRMGLETPFDQTNSAYYVGDFDGEKFINEGIIKQGHRGRHFYAAQTFNNVPDGRRIMIGWAQNSRFQDMPFSTVMAVPLELTLRSSETDERMYFYPVEEIKDLREKSFVQTTIDIGEANALLQDVAAECLDIEVVIKPGKDNVVFDIRGNSIIYNSSEKEVSLGVGEQTDFAPLENGLLKLRVLVDRSFIEVFVNDGYLAYSNCVEFSGNEIAFSGDAAIENLAVHHLSSAWKK